MKLRRFFGQGWVIAAISVIMGFLGGILLPYSVQHSVREAIGQDAREHGGEYRFISPLLACADEDLTTLPNDKTNALENTLADLIAAQKNAGKVSQAGVYFRELNGGPWIGVDFDAAFTPGSLLKVPLAMSVYHLSEADPGLLARTIEFEGGTAPATEHFTAPVIAPGTYRVEDLVRASLVNSDNNATLLLAKIIGKDAIDDSYAHLGITAPASGSDYATSVRAYASFFRILYNATYISRSASEKVLAMLTESKFTDGLVAGVPPGVMVAHKFGERALSDGGLVQLHDCGIVYREENPYLLCVMMRGKDFPSLASSIAEVSKLVWDSLE